ncbi:MAG: hypothetical protein V2I43_23840 [Parvularcula sp.]|jgi:hypothetical protein|nr:hypothetical protein [Parvularcula sp.]
MVILRVVLLILAAFAQPLAGLWPEFVGIEREVGDVVEPYRTALVPAGWAFSIWTLIFIGNLIFVADHTRAPRRQGMAPLGWLAAGVFAGNTAWVWYQPTHGPGLDSFALLEVILVLALAAALLSRRAARPDLLARTGLASLDLLAGWVTVASAAGLSLALNYDGWAEVGRQDTRGVLPVLFAWLPIAWALTFALRSWAYAAAIVWGLFAVAMANRFDPTYALGVGAVATSFLGLTAFAKRRGPLLAKPSAAAA